MGNKFFVRWFLLLMIIASKGAFAGSLYKSWSLGRKISSLRAKQIKNESRLEKTMGKIERSFQKKTYDYQHFALTNEFVAVYREYNNHEIIVQNFIDTIKSDPIKYAHFLKTQIESVQDRRAIGLLDEYLFSPDQISQLKILKDKFPAHVDYISILFYITNNKSQGSSAKIKFLPETGGSHHLTPSQERRGSTHNSEGHEKDIMPPPYQAIEQSEIEPEVVVTDSDYYQNQEPRESQDREGGYNNEGYSQQEVGYSDYHLHGVAGGEQYGATEHASVPGSCEEVEIQDPRGVVDCTRHPIATQGASRDSSFPGARGTRGSPPKYEAKHLSKPRQSLPPALQNQYSAN